MHLYSDVECAEFEVLKGSTKLLANNDISLLVEIHNIDVPSHYNNVIKLLKHHNYEITFENRYGSGESHVILRKNNNTSKNL